MNYLDELKSFGLPDNSVNARAKHYQMYDTITFATGTTQYNLFVNSTLTASQRNRLLPISNNEVVELVAVKGFLNTTLDFATLGNADIFSRSYLSVSVDDREKLKIPFLEFVNFGYSDYRYNATSTSAQSFDVRNRKRKLQFPIVLNSSSNVVIKIETTSTTAINYNGIELDLEFEAIKYDKLSKYQIDLRKGSNFERLSYSFYDTQQLSLGSATNYELFSTRNKNITDFSKTFPLGDKEVFSIENIELFTAIKLPGLTEYHNFIKGLNRSVIKIFVDDIEFFNYRALDMITLIGQSGSGGIELVTILKDNGGLTLQTPLTIPANSRVKATFESQALTVTGGVTTYFTVDLKGTLQRTVA